MKKNHIGRWDIESMEMWDREYIDLIEPGYFLINADGTGEFLFGVVSGSMDGRLYGESGRFEFSWEGGDDNDPACGRGWLVFQHSNSANGKIYFHMGDESSLKLAR